MKVSPKKILIIDSDSVLAQSFKVTLEEEGYEVIRLLSYEEALTFLSEVIDTNTHENICAIIFGHILDRRRDSLPFIMIMKDNKFKGIMLANASEKSCRNVQLEAGCTHQREDSFSKHEGALYLLKLLHERE